VRARLRPALSLVGVALVCAACAASAPRHSYVLAAPDPASARGDVASGGAIEVQAVDIPEAVDHASLIEVRGASERLVLEGDRWAEPLRLGIGRVLALELAKLSGARVAWAYPAHAPAAATVRVKVSITRLDASADKVALDAYWKVSDLTTGRAPREGASSLSIPVTEGGAAGLVAAQSRAVWALGEDIARRGLGAQGRD
jgi:uncharacterized lipoprotein YmbA